MLLHPAVQAQWHAASERHTLCCRRQMRMPVRALTAVPGMAAAVLPCVHTPYVCMCSFPHHPRAA